MNAFSKPHSDISFSQSPKLSQSSNSAQSVESPISLQFGISAPSMSFSELFSTFWLVSLSLGPFSPPFWDEFSGALILLVYATSSSASAMPFNILISPCTYFMKQFFRGISVFWVCSILACSIFKRHRFWTLSIYEPPQTCKNLIEGIEYVFQENFTYLGIYERPNKLIQHKAWTQIK